MMQTNWETNVNTCCMGTLFGIMIFDEWY